MSVARPTVTDLARIARRLGYDQVDEHAGEYRAVIDGLLDAYDTLDTVSASPSSPADASRPVWPVDPAGDPQRAWAVRTSIRTVPDGPLAGRRVAVKDSVLVEGLPMTNGSTLLAPAGEDAGYVAEFDATVVERVLAAGAEIVGTTRCEYFCLDAGSHTSAGGPVHNPHSFAHAAGGSSSGAAVAVATGAADLALGTDQAGSIRVPASWCGVVGLKPTHGLVPYTGIAPLDPMIDHAGPLARSVEDCARLLSVIAGPDGYDPRQAGAAGDDYAAELDAPVSDLRVGVLREGFGQDGGDARVDDGVRAMAADLRRLGVDVVDVSIPSHQDGLAVWTPLVMQGMLATAVHGQGFGWSRDDRYPVGLMRHLFGVRDRVDELPPTVVACALLGQFVAERHGQTYYGAAVNAIRSLRARYDAALADVDVLLMPTTPILPTRLPPAGAGVGEVCDRGSDMFGNTAVFNGTHHPALSLPCGAVDGLPIGAMLVGRAFDEATVLRLGHAYERRDG